MVSYLFAAGRAIRVATTWLVRHRLSPSVVAGFALGVAGWSAAHPLVSSFGFHRETIAGLLLAAAGSFAVGLRFAVRRRGFASTGLPALIAAAWLVALPVVLRAAVAFVAVVPVGWMTIEVVRVPLLLVAALIAFGVPAFCVGIVARRSIECGFGVPVLISAAAGIACNALLFAPFIGLHIPLLAVGVATAIVWLVRLARGTSSVAAAAATATEIAEPAAAFGTRLRIVVCTTLVGVGCGLCGRVLAQLAPESAYLLAAGVAVFLAGLAAGGLIARRLSRRTDGDAAVRQLGAVISAAGLMLPIAAFAWFVDRQLAANAFIAAVPLLMAIRIGVVAAAVLPLAIGCGMIIAASRRTESTGVIACSLAAGLAASGWLIPALGVVPIALAVVGGLLTVQMVPIRSVMPRTRVGWATAAIVGTVLVAESLQVGRYSPAESARLLFSTEAFIARQRGVPAELMPWLDDTRLLSTYEGPTGAVTLWKRTGAVCSMRIDGIPVAATSRLPAVCPLPSADAIRVALPLVMHQKPGSLLLLGDPLGLATQVAVGFPLRQIVCYDGTGRVLGAPEADLTPLPAARDDRVTVRHLAPRLAVIAETQRFDVVVSDVATPTALASTPYFTREFYAAAAARLTEDGIFCQRLRYADFGAEPLRVLAATLRGVFAESMLIEVGSGEFLVLGVRSGQTLVREGLTERLQRAHVRQMLATLGWDWSMPFALITIEQSGLDALAEEAAGRHTTADGRFAYTLPQETMRWGPKSVELQQATAGRTTSLVARGVSADEREDVLARIGEIRVQHEMMTKYPDQPWAYRKEVKHRLVETPRSVIRPVSGEVRRVLHPDDQRRLDYFEALGKAIQKKSPETLAKLESFCEPYDPLITYFLHHEIAPLYSELSETGTAGELAHRLYAAYFADPRDRSIRNVTTTIELLVAHPDVVADGIGRFDHLNGMIELLLGRWESRGMTEPNSPQVVMIDIDLSLDAIEAALAEMESLAPTVGLLNADWQLRKSAIERTLTRPLRKYRTTLLPHVRAAQRKAAELAEAIETPGEQSAR